VVCPDHPGRILQFSLSNTEAAGRLLGLKPDTNNKTTILELRAKGQTVFPPSLHSSGELVEWRDLPQEVPELPWVAVEAQGRLLAFLAIVLRRYPTVAGNRHNVCMALTGALLDFGLDPDRSNELVREVATRAGDEEAEHRGIHGAETRAKMDAGERYTGLPRLLELLGLEELERDVRKILGFRQEEAAPPPDDAIVVRPGRLPELVDEGEAALLKHGVPFYQRGGELVEAACVEAATTGDVRRAKGSLMLFSVGAPRMREALARAAPWYAPTAKGLRPTDPPMAVAVTLLARRSWRFPVLRAVLNAPTLDVRTGRVIQEPGYDAESGLLLDTEEGSFPRVREAPGRTEAEAALARIIHEGV
jgi:hypothetical protein